MKKILLTLLVFVAFFGVFSLYFRADFPYTHDGENHLARFANYKIALKEGQFPPRFAPNLFNHYGYPVFNFNYPLANILSVPFSALKISYEFTFKFLVIFAVLFGLLGVWKLTKFLSAPVQTRLLLLLVWLLQPFLITAIYYRGNIGEIFGLSFLPWLVWMALSGGKPRIRNIVLLSAFLLSHNITAVLGSGLFLGLSLVTWFRQRKILFSLLLQFGWAVLLTLWFWLPALMELPASVVASTGLVGRVAMHLSTVTQILWSPLQFGFSYAGGVDSLSFAIGLPAAVALLLGSIFTQGKKLFVILAWACVLLQLQFTRPLWEAVPALGFVQFPWRLSMFVVILLIPSFVYLSARSRFFFGSVLLLVIWQLLVIFRLEPVDYFHKDNLAYDVFSQSTSTENENRSKDFTYAEIADWQPMPRLGASESGSIRVESWSGSSRKYQVELMTPSIIFEPTMYFPGWQTTIEQNGLREKVSYIQNEVSSGRIAYSLPAGTYSVTSQFTQNTPARLLANSISLIALAGLLLTRKRYGK